jgi:phenylpropionate dioxygenase-like ring-hydroxylating dioxygenase large terminal subunit
MSELANDLVRDDCFRASLYTDPALFEREMERIFRRGWVWVAHESEIPLPGDFKTTEVARAPVIVTRGKDHAIHVLLNRCRHRAATVCEAQTGNARNFTCPYHAWTYGLDGRLIGIPYEDGYANVLSAKDLPLVSLKVGTYGGLIFASFNPDVEALEDYLGDARPWVDLFLLQGGGFPIKASGAHKFRFRGNWKIQLENTTDAYHFPVVHRSFVQSVDKDMARMLSGFMRHEGPYVQALGNGHSVAVFFPDMVDVQADDGKPIAAQFQSLADELAKSYPMERVRWIIRAIGGVGFNLNLFPNIGLSAAFLRELRPLAVDHTEIRHIALTMDGGPDAANKIRLRTHEKFQGSCGFGSPDDMEAWQRVQRGAMADQEDMWVLLNRGMARESHGEDGHARSQVSDETGMRAAYAMWKRMMTL